MPVKHQWSCEARIYSTNIITATQAADFNLHMEELGTGAMHHYNCSGPSSDHQNLTLIGHRVV